jgi:hypothetical protein
VPYSEEKNRRLGKQMRLGRNGIRRLLGRPSGPAPRGLYRFRVTSVKDAAIEIAEVEEDLLLFV